jgi:hypothetical protein
MKLKAYSAITLAVFLGLLAACGGDSTPDDTGLAEAPFVADSFLPGSLPGIALQRFAVKKTEDELQKYVGSLTATYYEYRLVGLVAALYDVDQTTVSVEIAQFDSDLNAFGYYSLTRPDGVEPAGLGAESYTQGNSFYFVQDRFVATLSAFEDSLDVTDPVRRLAVTISAEIGSYGTVPDEFDPFPRSRRVPASMRYTARSFLEIGGLDGVLSARYAAGQDTVILFYTDDSGGNKYLSVRESVPDEEDFLPLPETLEGFESRYKLRLVHAGYGEVIAGMREGKLIGMAGYSDRTEPLMAEWLGVFTKK